MNVNQLAELIELTEIHQQLLCGYDGPYSLGIGEHGLVLQVAGSMDPQPTAIHLGGESIPVEVVENWEPPVPL